MTRGPLPWFTAREGLSRISASAMNRLVDTLENAERRLVEVERRSLPNTDLQRPLFGVRRFVIEKPIEYPDTIGVIEAEGLVVITHVAKPYLFRRTPFHGKTRDGIEYTYTDTTKRIAKKTIPGNPPTVTEEKQVIIPKYVKGDVIYAIGRVFGPKDEYRLSSTGADIIETHWLDLNVDGRYWAKSAT